MKTYKSYKQTGIDWIEEIPDSWDILRLKYLSEINNSNVDKNTNDNESPVLLCNYVDTYKNEKITNDLNFMKATASKAEIEKFSIIEGDVIITKDSETPDDIAIPAYVQETTDNVLCGYHQTLIRPKNVSGKFLFRFFQSTGQRQYFETEARGVTRYGLSLSSIQNMFTLLPSKEEQVSITAYLDYKISLIDNLIFKNKQLIELLEEKKQATINQAVIKGLDPNVKMKDSGIEWIGEIPEHWKVTKLKRMVSKIGSGVTPKGGSQVYQDTGIKFLRSQNIQNDRLDLDDIAYISEEIDKNMSNSRVFKNDVLLNITGASIGRTYYYNSDEPANVNQHVCIIRPDVSILSDKYLYLVLLSKLGQTLIELNTTGSGREGLNFESISNFVIFTPNMDNQNEIVTQVFKEIKKIYQLKEKLKHQNLLLQEYRQALISNAVTGKIDVRDELIPEEFIKDQTL